MKPDVNRKLKRGMLIQYPDGRIERVTNTSRFPANTKWRKAGPRVFNTRDSVWNRLTDGMRVLGFVKP